MPILELLKERLDATVVFLLGFISTITQLFLHIVGIFECVMQLLFIFHSHLLVYYPKFFICSVLIPEMYCIMHPFGILCLHIILTRFMN